MTSTAPPSGRYRKKPITLPAIRYRGPGDLDYVVEFVGTVEHFRLATPGEAVVSPENTAYVWDYLHSTWVGVKNGDWILRGVKGEFYPHDGALFAEVFDQVNDDDLSPGDGAAGIDAAEVAVRDLLESPTPRGVHYHTPRAIARAALTAAAGGVTVARVETALRAMISQLDYDLAKSIEMPEEGGPDEFPILARDLHAALTDTTPETTK